MLYPLSYEGLACTFAQDVGRVSGRGTRADYLAPDGLCRTCAACPEPASDHRPTRDAIVRLALPDFDLRLAMVTGCRR